MDVLSKNIKISLATILLSSSIALADSSYIDYQGVAFDSGVALASSNISLRFTIYQSNGTTVVYQETQSNVATTDKGFFSHKIGSGIQTAGAATIDDVTWADDFKLKVEVDYANGTSYSNLGTQNISSSVYAKKALSADSLNATSLAIGNDTNATGGGLYSFAMGNGSAVSSNNSFAGGYRVTASANESFAFGQTSTAEGTASVAMGIDVNSSNKAAVAMGEDTYASGTHSFAMGKDTNASGNYAVAMGFNSDATGLVSFAIGDTVVSSASRSTAFGYGTIADQAQMVAIGQFNTAGNTDALFVVGNGSADDARADAFEVQSDGDVVVAGDLTVNGSISGNAASATTLTSLTSTVTELNYVDGATSNIQTQLDGKLSTTGNALTATTATNVSVAHEPDHNGDRYVTLVDGSGNNPLYDDAGLSYNPHTNTLTTTTFNGDLSGNAATATSATTATTAASSTTATNANNVNVEQDLNTEAYRYLTFVDASSAGNQRLNVDTGLKYAPISNGLYATYFSGSLDGNADTATKLASNPTDCGAGEFATAIDENGNLTCSTPSNNVINNTLTSDSTTESLSAAQGKVLDESKFNRSGGDIIGHMAIYGYFQNVESSGYYYYARDNEEDSNLPFTTDASTESTSNTTVYTSLFASHAIVADAFVAPSDRRVKESIVPLQDSLNIINKLNPVSYTKKDKIAYGGRKETGFIAQEVKEVLPSAVNTGKGFIPVLKAFNEFTFKDGVKYKIQITKDGKHEQQDYIGGEELPDGEIYVISKEVDDFNSIEYGVLYTHAIKAIQEQQDQIDTLKSELAQIKELLKNK